MALETIRNGYRGEQITEEIATPRYRSWEFELRRKATMLVSPIGKALLTVMMPSLPASAGDDASRANAKRKAEQS
jgi:hypothetical protein